MNKKISLVLEGGGLRGAYTAACSRNLKLILIQSPVIKTEFAIPNLLQKASLNAAAEVNNGLGFYSESASWNEVAFGFNSKTGDCLWS